MTRTDQIIRQIDTLPPMGHSALVLLQASRDDLVTPNELEVIIRRDEALVAGVLRMANSAMFGRPGRVFDLHESIVRLGHKTLLKIALMHEAGRRLHDAGHSLGLQRGELWKISIAGAMAAERLARETKHEDPSLCYICALLRKIGVLALDVAYGESLVPMLSHCASTARSITDIERAALGTDHAELGSLLARHWQLPETIEHAVRWHHRPPSGGIEHSIVTDLVHAGDFVAASHEPPLIEPAAPPRLEPHVADELGLDQETCDRHIELNRGELEQMESAMLSAAA